MKIIRIVLSAAAFGALSTLAWAQNSGSGGASGSLPGGTGVDSGVQSMGEISSKSSRGLAGGLESVFGGLTILGGQGVGDRVGADFALLGDDEGTDDYVILTLADDGQPVKVVVHQLKIVSIDPVAPISVAVPIANACS
ncbi:hypothetical protein [Solimonas terrae]|uniref:Curli production assembly/transport component CsgF n=1 Tax=Solimonas terrae TaxID=1396819 RepID=A0A6M2BQV8_9GAMM|nr:hypothetical protein [Solimonas terrae]NGY04858.1 hypothetical protein [Solimonas terrae]